MKVQRESGGTWWPHYEGELLSWSIGLYQTPAEERIGFPRMKAVIAAMDSDRLRREEREHVRDSFDRFFGHNAKTPLRFIREELARRTEAAER